jgi:DNA-binding CsgD family transcriptional regulator
MHAVVALLQATASACPLVLLVDDLHWAEQDTLDLLDFATRHLEQRAALVMATYRTEAVQRAHPLHDFLPQLVRDRPVESVQLGELSVAETALLVESRHGPCSPELAAYLHARADGNPLFLVELLRDLTERQLLPLGAAGRSLPPAASVQVPALLQQIVTQRIARLGPEAESLLEVAAVIGTEWDLALAEAILEWQEAPLLRALEAALTAKVIVAADEQTERYRFAHGLIREVLYGRQVLRRRKHLHARVGAVLEEIAASDEQRAEQAAALAYHFGAAEDWPRATQYSIVAGDTARDRFAGHSALRLYEQAYAAAQRMPALAGPALLVELHERLGHARMVLNQQEQAEIHFTHLLDAARLGGNRLAEGHALVWLSLIRTRLNRMLEARQTAAVALDVAEAVGHTRLLALAHWNIGHVQEVTGELDPAYQHAELAERLAHEGGHRDVQGWCLQNLAMMNIWRGAYARAETMAGEAVALAHATHHALSYGGACFRLGLARGELGRYEAARQALQLGLDNAEESGERRNLVKLLNTLGWISSELGDDEAAWHWDEQALAASRTGGDTRVTEAESYSLLNLATDALHAGDLGAAEAQLRDFEARLDDGQYARFRYVNRYHLLRCELALARGEHAAMGWAEEAAALAAAQGMRKNLAKCHLLRGRALLARGRPREAEGPLRQAVALADELEHGSLRWQARLWLGRACIALRRPATAASIYREAQDRVAALADQLPDEGLRARFLASPLVGELRATAAPLEPDAPRRAPADLTAREVEVLRLVAEGASNEAIAAALYISVKTVEAHMTSILGKLGCPNRAAAATFAIRQGLA